MAWCFNCFCRRRLFDGVFSSLYLQLLDDEFPLNTSFGKFVVSFEPGRAASSTRPCFFTRYFCSRNVTPHDSPVVRTQEERGIVLKKCPCLIHCPVAFALLSYGCVLWYNAISCMVHMLSSSTLRFLSWIWTTAAWLAARKAQDWALAVAFLYQFSSSLFLTSLLHRNHTHPVIRLSDVVSTKYSLYWQ